MNDFLANTIKFFQMNKAVHFAFILLFFISCSEEEHGEQVRNWEILALEKHVDDLNNQNKALSIILWKMNSNHKSIRLFTNDLITDIERVKMSIIEYAINGSELVAQQIVSTRVRGTYYPRTFKFEHKQIPEKLTRFVVKSLTAFDRHPSTKGNSLESFLKEMGHDDSNSLIRHKMFDGLNVGQAVQLLELVQIRILMEENKYQTSQFNHAINRMIAFPQNLKN